METDSAERLASLWFESAPAPHPETSVQERQRRAADLTNFLRDVVVQPEHSALIEKAPPALEQEIGATIYALAGSVLFEVAVLEGSEGLGYACQRLELTGARVAVAD